MFFNYSNLDKKYHSVNHFEYPAHHFWVDCALDDDFILYVGY